MTQSMDWWMGTTCPLGRTRPNSRTQSLAAVAPSVVGFCNWKATSPSGETRLNDGTVSVDTSALFE